MQEVKAPCAASSSSSQLAGQAGKEKLIFILSIQNLSGKSRY